MKARLLLGVKITRFDPVSNCYISHCPVLDMYSQGYTKKSALEAIQDTMQAWFDMHSEHGTLEKALENLDMTKNISGDKLPPS